ncbi:hypothetical protein [Pedobacter jejuensis]|nr:hypothetical protein [Pedobacter jejuensis]
MIFPRASNLISKPDGTESPDFSSGLEVQQDYNSPSITEALISKSIKT